MSSQKGQQQKTKRKLVKKKRKKDEKHFSRHLKYNWPWLKEFPQNYHTSQKKKKEHKGENWDRRSQREKQYLQERNFEHWCWWCHHLKFWGKILFCPCESWAKGGNVAKAMNWLWCYPSYLSLGPSHTWWLKQSWGRSGSLLMWKVIVIV